MRLMLFLLALMAAPAQAGCRLALVLALDVSASVDADEYRLQVEGMARALTSPDVSGILLSDTANPVALSVFVWSGPSDQAIVADWTLVTDAGTLAALAETIAAYPRRIVFDGRTAIGAALRQASFLQSIAPACDRKVVDVATDGRNNAGTDPQDIADSSYFDEVTINGLAIEGGTAAAEASLARYLRLRVTRGADSFVETAENYADFERAMTRKLIRELQEVVVGQIDAGRGPRPVVAAPKTP